MLNSSFLAKAARPPDWRETFLNKAEQKHIEKMELFPDGTKMDGSIYRLFRYNNARNTSIFLF